MSEPLQFSRVRSSPHFHSDCGSNCTIYYSSIEIERGADIGGKLVHEIPATNVTAFQKAGEASDSSSGHKPKVEK